MIPGTEFNQSNIEQTFVNQDLRDTDIQKHIKGGVAINDITQGRFTFNWVVFYLNGNIYVKRTDLAEPAITITATNVISIGATFDISSMPFVCWRDHLNSYLYYFNSVSLSYEVLTIELASSCYVNIDYSIEENISLTDVIFAYVKNNNLYYRYQRDRFTIEYTVGPTTGYLNYIGVSTSNRFQFEVVQPVYEKVTVLENSIPVEYMVPMLPVSYLRRKISNVPIMLS